MHKTGEKQNKKLRNVPVLQHYRYFEKCGCCFLKYLKIMNLICCCSAPVLDSQAVCAPGWLTVTLWTRQQQMAVTCLHWSEATERN